MTADRLRLAADRWQQNPLAPDDHAVVVLLLAIADAGQWSTDLYTGERWGVPWDVWRAALALADVILGDSDE